MAVFRGDGRVVTHNRATTAGVTGSVFARDRGVTVDTAPRVQGKGHRFLACSIGAEGGVCRPIRRQFRPSEPGDRCPAAG